MKFRQFREPLFSFDIFIYANCTPQDANRHFLDICEKKEIDGFAEDDLFGPGWTGGLVWFDVLDVRRYIMYIKNESDIGTISHECIHLVNRVFESRNVKVCEQTEEVFAYYHEYLMHQVEDSLKSGKNIKRKK